MCNIDDFVIYRSMFLKVSQVVSLTEIQNLKKEKLMVKEFRSLRALLQCRLT